MKSYQRTLELLKQLISSKQTLASTLVDKGEEASINEPFDDLVEKAGNYVPKTMVFVDEFGNETVGAIVSEETMFDATVNDVREGKKFVNDQGVNTGEKFIPSYHTVEGYKGIANGKAFTISTPLYDYTKLQVIICPYNTSATKSVAAEKVVINDNVYDVLTTDVIAAVTKDESTSMINLGITNVSGKNYFVRYFMYKEIY